MTKRRPPPPPKEAAGVSIVLAFELGRSYAELGRKQYIELNRLFNAKSTPQEVTAAGISAATILGLALELLAKVLVFQRKGVYPQVHNVAEVLKLLPEDVVASIRSRFQLLLAEKPKLLRFCFALGGGGTSGLGPAGQMTYDEAMEEAAELFVRLRYLHESFDNGFQVTIDFHSPLLLINAVWQEIDAFADKPAFRFTATSRSIHGAG